VKSLGQKISGKAEAEDSHAVQELDVLTATLQVAQDVVAIGVKQRVSAAALNSVSQLIKYLQSAIETGSFAKFEAEGQRQAEADAVLGLRSSSASLNNACLTSGCLVLVTNQKRLFVHPEGGAAAVGTRLTLQKDGPAAHLCFRFVSETPVASECDGSLRSSLPSFPDRSSSPPPLSAPADVAVASIAECSSDIDAAASGHRVIGRLQHLESGLFVSAAKAALPSPLVLISHPCSSAMFELTASGQLLHVASSAVVCAAHSKVSSGCALELRAQVSGSPEHITFALQPFECYSNGHSVLLSLFLAVSHKFRKYARALSSSTFVDPVLVAKVQHSSQVEELSASLFV
jgi:hypothetical protein